MKFFKNFLTHFVLLISLLICESRIFSKCFITEPKCPNKNVSFYFYTRNTQDKPSILNIGDIKTILNAKVSENRPLVMLIHGYTGDKDYAPNKQIRPAYFLKNDFNIISVDYSNLAEKNCYFWAVKNLPTVANCSSQLLNFLIDANIFKLEDIHVIGFSLGNVLTKVDNLRLERLILICAKFTFFHCTSTLTLYNFIRA